MNTKPNITTTNSDPRIQLFKLLGHPARLAILELLRDGEHCVCHLEAYLGLRQAAISQQLALLREAGLVLDRRDGWNVYYRLADTTIFALIDEAAALTGTTNPEPVGQSVNCCCPHCASKSKNISN
ncbi:MAG: metalloregulator ArsR/SmtB family transcription factor [Anaerolineaceae bacterium]|jgi:ArsR family transcriptional regulator|nr:metalloregulator ArsR/SmtB family transcription factor [Anaerolineaceae bacterium]